MELKEIRTQIDSIDEQIVDLLAKRAKLISALVEAKKGWNDAKDENREAQVLQRVKNFAADKKLDPHIVEELYRLLISYFVEQQTVIMEKKE